MKYVDIERKPKTAEGNSLQTFNLKASFSILLNVVKNYSRPSHVDLVHAQSWNNLWPNCILVCSKQCRLSF